MTRCRRGGIGAVSVQLTGNGVFAKSSTAGPYYFANIDSKSASFSAIGNFIQPPKASMNYRGFLIQSCYLCTIEANQFNGIYNPVSIIVLSAQLLMHTYILAKSPPSAITIASSANLGGRAIYHSCNT
jgi:hypothetical protein